MRLSDIGPYRVLRLLAAGGEGSVYLAEDRRLGRRVALAYVGLKTGRRKTTIGFAPC